MTRMLSKSRFLAGLQCPLRLWFQCYSPELATSISHAQQAIFDMGHEVGRLATELYSGGRRIEEDHLHHNEAQVSTVEAMGDRNIPAIFEAAFTFDDIRIRVDILERLDEGRWNLVEVKSSTSVKEVYRPDAAIQYYVLRGAGFEIARAGILHLNNGYVYAGNQIDLNQLFHFYDLTEEVIETQNGIVDQTAELKGMLASKFAPGISPSRHCFNPYKCEFWEHCTSEKPEYWIMDLSGISQHTFNQLIAMGVEDISEIPDEFPLTAIQERIKHCVVNKSEYMAPQLESELLDVEYPVHFLDFETIGTAVPIYADTRPYQTIPFQWSDHVLREDGTLRHEEYLCEEDKDPRKEFTETLLDALGEEGTIFIYTNYEQGILEQLAGQYPRLGKRLSGVIDRFKDLHAIIRRYYYHPLFHGSFSLKSVLPALIPSMSYSDLAIQEGTIASLEYIKMLDHEIGPDEKVKIRNNLLEYCSRDTMAMVEIRNELLARIKNS